LLQDILGIIRDNETFISDETELSIEESEETLTRALSLPFEKQNNDNSKGVFL